MPYFSRLTIEIRKLYRNEEIVLDYNDFVAVDFTDFDTQSKNDEIRNLIKKILPDIYEKEKKNFEESDNPENHIYIKLERLKQLL